MGCCDCGCFFSIGLGIFFFFFLFCLILVIFCSYILLYIISFCCPLFRIRTNTHTHTHTQRYLNLSIYGSSVWYTLRKTPSPRYFEKLLTTIFSDFCWVTLIMMATEMALKTCHSEWLTLYDSWIKFKKQSPAIKNMKILSVQIHLLLCEAVSRLNTKGNVQIKTVIGINGSVNNMILSDEYADVLSMFNISQTTIKRIYAILIHRFKGRMVTNTMVILIIATV